MSTRQPTFVYKKIPLIVSVLLITSVVYSASLSNGFTGWDDPAHFLNNHQVIAFNIRNTPDIFRSTVNRTYVPLTILSFAIEHYCFGFDPIVYHLDNLLLHLGVVLTVFLFAKKTGLSDTAAALSALIFGVHPMHVEAVAWVTARKDVLYALLYMLALNSYWDYLKSGKRPRFATALFWGLLSMLAKPMALSLPLILWLCDWFYRRRDMLSAALEKVWLLLYIVPIGWVTYSLYARIPFEGALKSSLIWTWTFMFYLWKFFLPVNLSALYELPHPISFFNKAFLLPAMMLIAIVLIAAGKKDRWLTFSLLFYFLSMFFLFRFDERLDLNIVADRYMYLPSLGFCLLLGKGWEGLMGRKDLVFKTYQILCVVIVASLCVLTFNRCKVWSNDLTLWTDVIKKYPENPHAYNNRAHEYIERGAWQLALADLDRALAIDPGHAKALNNRATVYFALGETLKALTDAQAAVAANPGLEGGYYTLGNIYLQKGDTANALRNYDLAIEMNSFEPEIYLKRAKLYEGQKLWEKAISDYSRALELRPDRYVIHHNLGVVYAAIGEYQKAIREYGIVLSHEPHSESYFNRGNCYYFLGNFQRAVEDYSRSIELNAFFADAYNNRASAYQRLGQKDLALRDLQAAGELKTKVKAE